MGNTDDKDTFDPDLNNLDGLDIEEDFDYQKEIDELQAEEAQEKKERGARRAEKERRQEAEWLGEKKPAPAGKKSRKGLAAVVIIILIIIAGAGGFLFKKQADRRTVADFAAKVSEFQTNKLDGAQLGSQKSYFEDFMNKCQTAAAQSDISAIRDLQSQWDAMEKKFDEVSSGMASLTAFKKTADSTLAKFSVPDELKEDYDKFQTALKNAVDKGDYGQVETLQKQLDALVTNLNSGDLKTVQQLQNDIAGIGLNEGSLSASEQKQLKTYADTAQKQIEDKDYAGAVKTLTDYKKTAQQISDQLAAKVKAEQEKAAAESRARAAAESQAQAQAESIARAKYESQQQAKKSSTGQTQKQTSSSGTGSSSGSSGSYILPKSSSAYLTDADVKNLSSQQLMLARNEIYARHGYIFRDSSLRSYFSGKSWYKGTVKADDFSSSVFNKYEIANIKLIQQYE